MSFDSVIGQKRIVQFLQRALAKNRLAHAYLFWGPEGIGKWALAVELAKAVNCETNAPATYHRDSGTTAEGQTASFRDEVTDNPASGQSMVSEGEPSGFPAEPLSPCDRCTSCLKISALSHPDLELLFPLPVERKKLKNKGPVPSRNAPPDEKVAEPAKGGEALDEKVYFLTEKRSNPYRIVRFDRPATIIKERIRDLQMRLSLRPFESKRRIVIITEAEKMRSDVTNIFLKTIEEPPLDTIIILTTENREALLPTLQSRCQLLRLEPVNPVQIADQLQKWVTLTPEDARLLATLADGSPGKALYLTDPEVQELLQQATRIWANLPTDSLRNALLSVRELLSRLPREQLTLILDFWQFCLHQSFSSFFLSPTTKKFNVANSPSSLFSNSFGKNWKFPPTLKHASEPVKVAQTILQELEQVKAHLWVNVNPTLTFSALLLKIHIIIKNAGLSVASGVEETCIDCR